MINTPLKSRISNLLKNIESVSCRCPAHSNKFNGASLPKKLCRTNSSEVPSTDYAFEMAASNIRYGPGVTAEVGMDFANMKSKNVGVYTDKNLINLPVMKTTLESLTKAQVNFKIYDNVRVEPTDASFKDAAEFARKNQFDAFLAVGGGSVIDTTKAANLYASDPGADFLDYVNAPIGKGNPVRVPLKPLVAVPTTSGTGSETTGVAIFDYEPLGAKTGIANRALRPLLGIVDPLHTLTMPERVTAYSGFDVLCHSLESFTALSYTERSPRPPNPIYRPAYQGSNPISDVWARETLRIIKKYFGRSVYNPDDIEARSQMHLASTFAGVGFGNAGVHLCHGLSYSIAGGVKKYQPEHYSNDHPIIPHGLSVVITAPAVFKFTGALKPDRHLEAAELLSGKSEGELSTKGRQTSRSEDSGLILADVLREIMLEMKVEDGLKDLGFNKDDLPKLVEGAIPQDRVNKLAPRPQSHEDLYEIYENSLSVYN